MSISLRDLSNYDGAPITLYTFSRRSVPTMTGVPVVTYWRYTGADRDYALGDVVYTAIALSNDGIRQSGDAAADQLTITMPADAAIPQLFAGSPPSDTIMCMIQRTHRGEEEAMIAWAGVVGMVTRTDDISAAVICNTLSATMDRTGLRLSWSRSCPHTLYDQECRADPRSFQVQGPVTALNGAIVICDAFTSAGDGRLNGGYLEWIAPDGHAERRGIVAHGGNTVRVMGTTDKLAVGTYVYAFLGCQKTRQWCHEVFNNIVNHGGHAYMPDVNPFSGDLIF